MKNSTEMRSFHVPGFQELVPARAKSIRGQYSLWALKTNKCVITCWHASLWSRVKFLFHGKVWIETLGANQPAVAVHCKRSIIKRMK